MPRRRRAQQELVRQIQEELKRLNKLITDVSNASRLDAELAFEETEPVDLRKVLDAVFQVFDDILSTDTRRVVLEIEEVPGNPDAFVVRGHEARLGRVITNLLDNAISFSPEHGVVTVRGAPRRGRDRARGRRRRPGHPLRQARGHLQALLFGSAADRQHGRQELGPGPEHLARDRQAYGGRIWAGNRMTAPGAEAFALDEQAELRDRRAAGVAGTRFTVRLPAADATPSKGAPSLARRS